MTNKVIRRFNEYLQSQVNWDRKRATTRSVNKTAHGCRVRNFWVREVGSTSGRPHYHCLIFLNRDAYRSLGLLKPGRDNMYNRVLQAWARALCLPEDDVIGAVEFVRGCTFNLTRKNYSVHDEFFRRSSYLCKAATKHYGNGLHGCGGSRG